MDFKKRKLGHLGLERRVRARADPEPEEVEDIDSGEEGTDNSASEDNSDDSDNDDQESGSEGSEEEEEESASDEDELPAVDISSISFGALARAQASISRPDKRRKSGKEAAQEDSTDREKGRRDRDDDDQEARRKAKKAAALLSRANKHAPQEMSSSRQVSRRREVVSTAEGGARRQARDPRFDPAVAHPGGRADERAYAFLDEYREDEMAALRLAIKKAGKNSYEREQLQRALKSMEGKRDAKRRLDRERAVVEEHRRREKELVKQGKKPFYLKKSEQKKRLLLDQFAGMSDKQVDKTIAKRRKKQAAKERMDLPLARRGME